MERGWHYSDGYRLLQLSAKFAKCVKFQNNFVHSFSNISVFFYTISNAEFRLQTATQLNARVVTCAFSDETSTLCYCLAADGQFWRIELTPTYHTNDGRVVTAHACMCYYLL